MQRTTILALTLSLAACDVNSRAETPVRTAPNSADPQASARADENNREFRDWYVTCNNANACWAFGRAPDDQAAWVRVSIPAGPQGMPSVTISFWPETIGSSGPMTAQVDGVTFASVIDPTYGEEDLIGTVDPGDVRALIDRMADGQTMTLARGSDVMPISLDGAAASLLWIDERQGRLGTTTALIRKGSRPASTVPAAPALPRVEAAPPVSQAGYGYQEGQTLPPAIEALPYVVNCRAEMDYNPELRNMITSARLDQNTVLWSVPCGAGAYNTADAYFTADPSGANVRQVMFPSPNKERADLLTNSGYDPATRIIEEFNKGRGLGDCGVVAAWTWTTQGFVLTDSSAMGNCNGVPIDYWPNTWTTE